MISYFTKNKHIFICSNILFRITTFIPVSLMETSKRMENALKIYMTNKYLFAEYF